MTSGGDEEFVEHMRLLALDPGSARVDPVAERRERMREELRMTPLFSPAVKSIAVCAVGAPHHVSEEAFASDPVSDRAHGGDGDGDDTFPQYGLLAGALSYYVAPMDKHISNIEANKPAGDFPRGTAQHQQHPTLSPPHQLTEVADPRIFLNVNTPWSAFICGSQGSGKSHTLSCMLESCLLGNRNAGTTTTTTTTTTLGRLPRPLAGIVFHYDKFSAANTASGGPSADGGDGAGSLGQICEAAWLCSAGLPVRVLVSPSNLRTMQRAYLGMAAQVRSASAAGGRAGSGSAPSLVVKPLLLQERHLSIDRIMRLMAVSDGNGPVPLYISTICKLLRDMAKEAQDQTEAGDAPVPFNYHRFRQLLQAEGFSEKQTDPLKLRLDLLESFMDMEEQGQRKQQLNLGGAGSHKKHLQQPGPERAVKKSADNIFSVEPGTLTIVDLSCPFVDKASACLLFDICLEVFLEQPVTGPSARIGGRVIALDEAHKYMTDTASAAAFTEDLLQVVRLQRHLATRVVISTQEPTISPKLLELSSMTFVHRFTSPAWFKALRTHLAGASANDFPATAGVRAEDDNGGADGGVGDSGAAPSATRRSRDTAAIFREIVELNVGEALLFAPSAMLRVARDGGGNTDGTAVPQKLGMAYAKVRVRKRVTADGGRSLLAA